MLSRLLASIAVLAMLIGSATAQDNLNQPVEVTEDLPIALLDQWDVKCYAFMENRQRRVNSAAVKVNVFRPRQVAVVLTSTWVDDGQINILDDWQIRDGTRRLQERIYATYGGTSFLSVEKIHVDTSHHLILGVREGDQLKYTIDGAPGTEPMNAETLTVGTFMRLVTILPMVEGSFEARDWFDIPEMENSETPLPIVCHGAEPLYMQGIEHDSTKYRYGGYTAWVRNNDRVLLKLEMPGRRYLELLKGGNCCSADRLRKFVDQVRDQADDQNTTTQGTPRTEPAAPTAPAEPADPGNPLPF